APRIRQLDSVKMYGPCEYLGRLGRRDPRGMARNWKQLLVNQLLRGAIPVPDPSFGGLHWRAAWLGSAHGRYAQERGVRKARDCSACGISMRRWRACWRVPAMAQDLVSCLRVEFVSLPKCLPLRQGSRENASNESQVRRGQNSGSV